MFCRNCGKQINSTDKFCVNCGFKVDNDINDSEVLETDDNVSNPVDEVSTLQNSDTDSNVSTENVEPAVDIAETADEVSNAQISDIDSNASKEEVESVVSIVETDNGDSTSQNSDTNNSVSPEKTEPVISNPESSNVNSNTNQNNTFNNPSYTNNFQANNKQGFLSSLSGLQKGLIIGLLSLFLILLVAVCFTKGVFGNSNNGTRTIMIYIDGSNLETDGGIVTADLNAINPSMINLEKTNILLYTGGTKKWHNYIKNDENGIYLLTKSGFEKVKTYPQKNMGDPNTFSEFLNYAYDNYKADTYNLVMYDHGGAIDGAIYDDFTGDNLSLKDLSTGLRNSPFNKKNKLQAVLFRTCLNGTLEVGTIFVDYADYMIASEEVTYGAASSNVLSFLNNVTPGDNAVEFGKKFFASYDAQINDIDLWGQTHTTYSVVDLSKIGKVVDEVNKYFSSVDMKAHYNDLARVRASVYQYGTDENSYDTIDLYDFVQETSSYSSKGSKALLAALDKAIVHNHTDLSKSHGMSIYFPYKGSGMVRSKFLNIYKDLTGFKDYYSFISKFDNARRNQKPFAFDLSKNTTKKTNKDITMTLTDEQVKNYAGAVYVILKKDPEHPNYYYLYYSSNDVSLEGNSLTAEIANKMIKIRDKSDKNDKPGYIYVKRRVNGGSDTFETYGTLVNSNADLFDDGFMTGANIRIAEKNGKPVFSTVTASSSNERVNGTLLNINEFTSIDLPLTRRRVLDAKGKVMSVEDWEAAPELQMYELKVKDVELSYSGLDNAGEYYCLFFITDINNNEYHSELIKVGG